MTKKDAVQQFRWDWADFVKSNPNFRGDSIAKRCAFNDYVDSLNKDGLVTDYQAYNWSNPFKIMRTILFFVTLFLVVTNTFNVRTKARILTSNVLDTTSNIIHPYRSY